MQAMLTQGSRCKAGLSVPISLLHRVDIQEINTGQGPGGSGAHFYPSTRETEVGGSVDLSLKPTWSVQ